MKCPACGFEQPQSSECLRCGIVFEKYARLQEERRRREEQERRLDQEEREKILAGSKEIYKHALREKKFVSIETIRNRISGFAYITKGKRLTDLLNEGEIRFIALTDAKIYAIEGSRLMEERPFVSINKDHIIMVSEE